ncbi:MAG: gamma carbonic anhydrase family protein [Planctomycetaceae bacterium]|nr:gamma carbonic anhydrase family protein [Planctomycetaceae bacterium]
MPGGWYKASNAIVCDDVTIGEDSSFWFGVVARGDIAPIIIGKRTNVQDLACLHVDPARALRIGDDVSIAHHAVVHCDIVGNACLIGMHAIILGGAKIGEGSVIAAGALVPEGREIPPRSLVMGIPGKVVRQVTAAEYESNLWRARSYVENARRWHQTGSGVPAKPLNPDTGV